jgi:hypothetical protein
MSRDPDPIDCAQALAMLADYLKAEVTPAEAAAIHRHLELCRICFTCAEFERNFLRMLQRESLDLRCPEAVRLRILLVLRQARGDA